MKNPTETSPVIEVESSAGTGLVLYRDRTDEQKANATAHLDATLAHGEKVGVMFGEPLLDEKMFNALRTKLTRDLGHYLGNADLNIHDAAHMMNYIFAMASVLGCTMMTFVRTYSKSGKEDDATERMKRHVKECLDFTIEREGEKFDEFVKETGFTAEKGIRSH